MNPLQITAQLREATTGPMRAWFNDHAERIALHAKRALIASAGRTLGRRDVGEKIGGARKDMAAMLKMSQLADLEAVSPGHAYKAVTKNAVLGEFDAHAARAAGDTAGGAYAKMELFRTIASRPGDSPALRRGYVFGCEYLLTNLPACHTFQDVYWFLLQWAHLADLRYGSGRATGAKIDEIVTKAQFDERFPGRDAYTLVQRAGFRLYERTPDERYALFRMISREETEQFGTAAAAMGDRFFSAVKGRGGTGRYGSTPAFHDAVYRKAGIYERSNDWSWSEEAEAPEGQEARPKKRQEFVLVRKGLTGIRKGGPEIGAVTGAQLVSTFNLRALEHGNWMSDTDADTGERAAFGALLDLSVLLGVPREMMGFRGRLGLALGARGASKAAAHYEPSFRVINMTKMRGAGTLAHEWGHAMDHWLADRSGKSGAGIYCSQGAISGSPQIDAAFRHVMLAITGPDGAPKDERRRRNPLPMRPNPPPREIKTDEIVDWKDRNDRVNALNEWNTAIGKAISEARKAKDEAALVAARAEMDAHALAVMAFRKLDQRYKAKGRERAQKKDTRKVTRYLRDAELLGDYWARPQELFARAWESWVEDELVRLGWASTYLVVGTRSSYAEPREWNGEIVDCEPYPQGAEREMIGDAMGRLVAALAGRTS